MGVAVAVAVPEVTGDNITIPVELHVARTASIASASTGSMVRLYSRRIWTMRYTYQHSFSSGSHSDASLSLFWWRLTLGDASVRFSRSDANSALAASLAAHKPPVVGLGAGDDMLDVSFPGAVKPGACVGTVYPTLDVDDLGFNRRRVVVVVRFVV